MFALAKWYLDLVTEDGAAVVAYAARLRWGAIRLGYASILRSGPGHEPEEAATVRRGGAPQLVGDRLTWNHRPLGVTGEWTREAPALEATLLDEPRGRIHWRCVAPRARATVTWRGSALAGRGYVERIDLTVPPRHLPFRSLRWGRHLSDRHAAIWIDLAGDPAGCRIWLDGAQRSGASLTNLGADLGGGVALELFESRTLRDRRVAPGIMSVAPALRRRLGPLAGMQEHKELSRSALMRGSRALDTGWTIHEKVTW